MRSSADIVVRGDLNLEVLHQVVWSKGNGCWVEDDVGVVTSKKAELKLDILEWRVGGRDSNIWGLSSLDGVGSKRLNGEGVLVCGLLNNFNKCACWVMVMGSVSIGAGLSSFFLSPVNVVKTTRKADVSSYLEMHGGVFLVEGECVDLR